MKDALTVTLRALELAVGIVRDEHGDHGPTCRRCALLHLALADAEHALLAEAELALAGDEPLEAAA